MKPCKKSLVLGLAGAGSAVTGAAACLFFSATADFDRDGLNLPGSFFPDVRFVSSCPPSVLAHGISGGGMFGCFSPVDKGNVNSNARYDPVKVVRIGKKTPLKRGAAGVYGINR